MIVSARSAADDSRSRRAASASASPCSIRARRSASIFAIGLAKNAWNSAKNRMKFAAATMIQNKLIVRPPAGSAAASRTTSPDAAPAIGKQTHS